MDKSQLLIDPGFGFGKTLQHNLRLLNQLEKFKTLGVPILVGMSRKSMIGQVINKPFEERLHAGLALTTLAVLKGAHIIRVHDVAPTVDAIKMTRAVMEETI
jgi:dihydropteroate synthase